MATEKEKQAIEEIEKSVEELKKKIEMLTSGNSEKSEDIHVDYDGEFNIPEFSSEKKDVKEKVDSVLTKGKDVINKGVETIKTTTSDIASDPKVSESFEKVKTGALNVLDSAKAKLEELKTNEDVKDVTSKAKSIYDDAVAQCVKLFNSAKETVEKNPDAKKVIDNISAGVKVASDKVNEFLKSEQVAKAVDKSKDVAIDATQKFADFVKKTLDKNK